MTAILFISAFDKDNTLELKSLVIVIERKWET